MILKVSNEYLDFNADIELERQIKLFEDVSKTAGDFSYAFEVELTNHNIRVLQCPFPDNAAKNVYHKVDAELLGNDGNPLIRGFIRVEKIRGRIASCSFFSGNNNWFAMLSGPLADIDFSEFDSDQNITDIIASKGNTSGITWPIIDSGPLITRSYRQMTVEDFSPGIYVHTVIKKIFQYHSIKLRGELLNDPTFKSITTHRGVKSTVDIDASSSYVEKTSTTLMPTELDFYKVTWDNDSTYPFYDGDNDPFDLPNSRWVAPEKMRIRLEASLTPEIIDSSYSVRVYIYINGVFTFVDVGLAVGGLYNDAAVGDIVTIDRRIVVEKGDVIEIYSQWQQSSGSTQNNIVSGTLKITPEFIYHVSGASLVPPWTQQEYVSTVLAMFNVISSYDAVTKTLTLNLFDKIKSKRPVDISEYVNQPEVDYSQFISNYGKRNLFSYSEEDFGDLRDYNIQNFFRYAQGSVDVDNDHLEDSQDVLESDFSSPVGYLNTVFDMSMERMDLITLQEDETVDFTFVNDDGTGQAILTVDKDIFFPGDVVRITESTNAKYNGDWVVDVRSTGSIELEGLNFDTDATGKVTRLIHSYNDTDSVYVLYNIPDYALSKFSGRSSFRLDTTNITRHSVAFFSLLNTTRQINQDYVQGLSFGPISHPLFYQRTLLQSYWSLFEKILNDPVMLIFEDAHLPFNVNAQIDFLSPIFVKTQESSNLYYCNRQTGYRSKEFPCILELIKLP
jgi:hypothetical protein